MIKVRLAGTDGTALRAGRIRNYGQNTDDADEPDRIPVTDDPDDIDDPDDRTEVIASLPEMPPASWWIHMTLDPPDTAVSPEDVRLVFWYIRCRLTGQEAATAALRPSGDAPVAFLPLPEGGDSGQDTASDAIAQAGPITTVGQLHEAIEVLGPGAWSTFTALWQQSCGIEQPEHKQKPDCAPCPAAEPHGKPDTSLPPLPANAPLLEEGLHRELSSMPERVAAFLLHVPRDPPVWRYHESPDERSQREQLENEGCWTG